MSTVKYIKDYLPFYIGCNGTAKVRYGYNDVEVRCTLLGINIHKGIVIVKCQDIYGNEWDDYRDVPFNKFKLSIRPLSSMTEEETAGMPHNSMHISAYKEGIFYHPKLFIYLLSLHFDLFDLINSGLALEKQQEVKK